MKKIMTRLLSLVLLGTFIPSFVLAADWDLDKGSITVSATVENQTVSQAGGSPTVDSNPVITSSSGTTNNTVTITAEKNATANVTLENVNIDVSSNQEAAITTQGQGNVTLNLSGDNSVQSGTYHAGVHKENTGNLTVTAPEGGTGSLNATGGQGGAGIGGGGIDGNGNNITISGGTVDAKGGEYSAGIGGGGNSSDNNASKITISGGNVTATGAGSAAGIGGGNGGSGTDIEITGGKVKATGGQEGAGIGGGKYGNGSGITVSGGEVFATGKDTLLGGGAGIGGGSHGNGSDITISGGEVTATGGIFGAGIGGGDNGVGQTIVVTSGKVNATSIHLGAGIGGGYEGAGTGIIISGGEVTATGGESGAGIGGGTDADGTGITISGGEVNAIGGYWGAGIGGGERGNGSNITVSHDAQVKVQGGEAFGLFGTGAGIGGGGKNQEGGAELPQDPDKLNDGTIRYYAPGANMQTDAPTKILYNPNGNHNWDGGTVTTPATCITPGVKTYTCPTDSAHTKTEEIPVLGHLFETYVYNNDATTKADGTETAHCAHPGCNETDTRTVKGTKLTEHTAETVPESKAAAYWVCDPEGQSIPYQAQQKDGVLTVTVQADTASLRGTTGSLGQLEAQGIAEIRFVTNGAQSAFTLADLLASGTGSFTLTHEAETVTFTLESTDISKILK